MYAQIGRLDLLNDTRHLYMCLKPCENGRNIAGFNLLRPFAHPFACFACCWELLRKVSTRK